MSIKTKRILVPIGFSEQSHTALDQAVIIAKAVKAEIVLIAVMESSTLWKKIFSQTTDEKKLKEETLSKLQEVIATYSAHGVRIEPMVAQGVVYEEIARAAEMLMPELVVMGTNGRPENFKKKILGSNAYNVAKQVKEPVLIVKGIKNFTSIKNIVFPVLLERKSKEKVTECIHWARVFDAKVRIVAVTKNKDDYNSLLPHVNQVSDFMTKHGVENSTEMIRDEKRTIPQALIEYTDQIDADMMIIMDDGDEGWSLFASDVVEVIYNSDFPVMCIAPIPGKYAPGFQAI